MSSRRFARQARLAEVGMEGQARIEGTSVTVQGGSPLAHEIAALYLARAGAAPADATKGVSVVCGDHDLALTAGPQDVAIGALAALVALRVILGLGPPDAALATSSAR